MNAGETNKGRELTESDVLMWVNALHILSILLMNVVPTSQVFNNKELTFDIVALYLPSLESIPSIS